MSIRGQPQRLEEVRGARTMFYWSHWTTINTTTTETRDERKTYSSRLNTGYQQAMQAETRPVVVIRKSNAQVQSATAAYQQRQTRGRDTSSRISLDVKRQAYARTSATHTLSSTRWHPEATTETISIK